MTYFRPVLFRRSVVFTLKMRKDLRLPRPVGVDWLRQVGKKKLEQLQVGKFVWLIIDGNIQCAEITHPSTRVDVTTKPVLHGTQVYFTWRHKGTTHVACPHLIYDGKESGLYRIIDIHAAEEYYDKIQSQGEEEISLKLVANNGGSG